MKVPDRLAWLCATVILTLCACCVPAFAAEADFDMEEGGFYNIVLLMDKSGSMNDTDPNRNAVNEAKMFVHSLYTGVQNKKEIGADVQINLGILAFSRDPEPNINFIELDSDSAVQTLMDTIDAIRYDRMYTGATDLGKAVDAAVGYLNGRQTPNHTGLVVLFTDGYTQYLSSEPNKAQLEAESAALLQKNLGIALQNGYEIYVIGLNHEERIKPAGRAEIMRIANETQIREGLIERNRPEDNAAEMAQKGKPKKNYVITDSLREIQNFYIQLFADLMRSAHSPEIAKSGNQSSPTDAAGENFPAVYFDIPIDTNRVSCCNIYVTSEGNIEDVRLFNPSGVYASSPAVSIKKDRDGKYAILSLWRPATGNWRLGVDSDAPFSVQYVPISSMKIKTTPLPAQDGEMEFEIRAFYDNEDITANVSPNLVGGGLTMASENRTQTKYPIYYDTNRNVLTTGKISVPEPGNYVLYTSLAPSTTELKVSKRPWAYPMEQPPEAEPNPNPNPEEPTPEPNPEPTPEEPTPEPNPEPTPEEPTPEPELKSEPLKVSVKQGNNVKINMEDAFLEWDDQNTLTVTDVECPDPDIPIEIDNNALKVEAKKAPSEPLDLVVHATDSFSHEWDIPVQLNVTKGFPLYLLLIIPFLLALVLGILVLIVLLSRRKKTKTPPAQPPQPPQSPQPPTQPLNGQTTIGLSQGLQGGSGSSGVSLNKNQNP